MPDSDTVGNSGMPSQRFAPVKAMVRRRPALMCGITVSGAPKATWISLAITAVMISAKPL
jgi:hypothetical protein